MDDKRSGNDISAHRVKVLIALIMVLYGFPTFMMLAFSYSMPGIASELRSSMAALRYLERLETAALVAGSVIVGFLADSFGRKPLLLIAMGTMAAGTLMYSLSSSAIEYAAWRFIAVASGAGISLTLTLLSAELVSEKRRAFVIVLIGFGSILGVMGGSTLAGMLLDDPGRDWRVIMNTLSGLTLACLLLVWCVMPESPDWRQAIGINRDNDDWFGRIRQTMRSHWPLLAAYFLMGLVIYWLLRGVIPALVNGPLDMGSLISRFSMGSLVGNVLLLGLLWKYPCQQLARYILLLAAVVTLAAAISPFITATIPWVLFSVSLFCNTAVAVLRVLAIIELLVVVRGIGSGLLVLLMQVAIPLASFSGSRLMASTPGFVALWVLMCISCLICTWLVMDYARKMSETEESTEI